MYTRIFNTIAISIGQGSKRLEGLAGEEILPGQMVEYQVYTEASAPANLIYSVDRHTFYLSDDSGSKPFGLIAVENRVMGKGYKIPYVVGEEIYVRHVKRGDVILGCLKEGSTIAIGDTLGIASDTPNRGCFKKVANCSNCLVIALEGIKASVGLRWLKMEVY